MQIIVDERWPAEVRIAGGGEHHQFILGDNTDKALLASLEETAVVRLYAKQSSGELQYKSLKCAPDTTFADIYDRARKKGLVLPQDPWIVAYVTAKPHNSIAGNKAIFFCRARVDCLVLQLFLHCCGCCCCCGGTGAAGHRQTNGVYE